jgi:hypothetical protein
MAKLKRPRDPNQLAKSIVDIITGERENDKPKETVYPGQRKGGLKGGVSRAKKLTAQERSEIAKKAAAKRWTKP